MHRDREPGRRVDDERERDRRQDEEIGSTSMTGQRENRGNQGRNSNRGGRNIGGQGTKKK